MERRLSAIMAADMANFSHLIEKDELGTLSRQKTHRNGLIDPSIAAHRGRIVKTTGDGLLVEFPAVQDAVGCAMELQAEMSRREIDQPPDDRISYRIGINLGDMIFDEGDIFGDGVNVAARLEALAEPGGLCVSDIVHQSVPEQMGSQFRYMGSQRVKNISRPIRAWTWTPERKPDLRMSSQARQQDVRYCRSADGTTIAWASAGEGAAILRAPHWMNHLEYEWKSPFQAPFLERWAAGHRLVRFDQRGNGLSDWEVTRVDIDAIIEDMEAVVAAADLDTFALLGISQGASFSILYALKHPERVSCLVLLGGYLRGRLQRNDPEQEKLCEASRLMIRDGWGSNYPMYRSFFTNSFLPDAPQDVRNKFDELQRMSISPENALRVFDMNAHVDVPVEMAAQLRVPVLVAHSEGDRMCPLDEGRRMARAIPGARFVELSGSHHVPIESDAAFGEFFDAALPFIEEHCAT